MRHIYLLLGTMLIGTMSLLAQINYTVTFSANYDMDSVQVKNTFSSEVKMLYNPDNVITLQKNENQNVAVSTMGSSIFLQQTANNMVSLNVETASQLNLTLYSANGRVIARYANTINVGTHTFQVGASAGVYVLVATLNNQTASIKISLTENSQTSISEIATQNSVAFLKSTDDIITFNEGDVFEFTGFYKLQTDKKKTLISNDTTIVFTFQKELQVPVSIENGAIKAGFSVSEDKQVFFSQGNLQYQASTNTWRFAEKQWEYVGTQTPDYRNNYGGNVAGSDNANISSNYSEWIDLFGWGTSGYNTKYPYMTYTGSCYYGTSSCNDGDYKSNDIAGTNYDWGVYNKIINGGNQARQWRTLTKAEWYYVINTRTGASDKKGVAIVNGVTGMILLPDNWTLPNGISFVSGTSGDFAQNTYSISEWNMMEANGAVFLPAGGNRYERRVTNVGEIGWYWSSSVCVNNDDPYGNDAYVFKFQSSYVYVWVDGGPFEGGSVRLVQDME